MSDKDTNNSPIPDEKVFYGIAGEIVKKIEPETESDPMALLISFLVAFGNIAGKNCYYEVESTEHYPNLFAAMVGSSSKARKGTSWNIIKKIFNSLDKEWSKNNVKSGLSSGEGLKYTVRDAVTKIQEGEEIITDGGIMDKRLFIRENEFANALIVANRAGNTLSTSIRDAWDTGDLATLTKNDPIKATGAHISILGHITKQELMRHLTTTEAANGYANRFLWVYVRRNKLLPFGGNITYELLPLNKLKNAVEFAQTPKRIIMSGEAKEAWKEIYTELSSEQIGLLGSITSRAEAQVIRLALVYALLECSHTITREHLIAGLCLWKYCAESAHFIFGEKFGDDTIDTIISHLRQKGNGGMTRTELHKIFANNKNGNDIDRAISDLVQYRKIRVRQEKTPGRPAIIYELNELNELS